MLFCYPVDATHENWLHDGLVALLARAFRNETNPLTNWLDVFPAERREEIGRKRSLLAALEKVVKRIAELDSAERDAFIACMEAQNRIPEVFDPATPMPIAPAKQEAFLEDVQKLFEVGFRLLTSTGVRDRQYERIYHEIPAHICAFCGIEPLTAPDPEIPRESLDHYLAISHYPFAGANLRNLAPAGTKCNSSHKLKADILKKESGTRRRCFDPFGGLVAQVSLRDSRPLEGETKDLFVLPAWQIELVGDAESIETWDAVFSIKTRYRLNVLNAEMRNWLDHFASWASMEAGPPNNADDLLALIERYRLAVIQEGYSDFLKRATFDMLAHQCREGPSAPRVTDWLISLLSPGTGAVALDD